MFKRILLVFIFIISQSKLYADGCSGPAMFTATYDVANCCYFFTNTTNNDCGSPGICTWDFGDGSPAVTTIQGASTVCHHYNQNGIFTVSLIYDARNCYPSAVCTGSYQVTISIFADAGPSNTICAGNSTTLNPSGGVSYAWTPSTGLSCTNCQNPSASPSTTTTYSVTVTDNNGCTATDTVSVSVINNWFVDAGPYQHICRGGSVPLNITAQGTIQWTPATGLNCTNCPNPTATPTSTTTYTVSSTNGICNSSDTVTVAVTNLAVASSLTDNYLCGGCAGTASVTASGGTPAYIYSWNNGNTSSALSSLCVGTYTLTVRDANNCTSSSAFIITQPIPISSTESHTNALCNGDNSGTGSVSASNGTPPYSYLWNNGATTSSSSGLAAGTYLITVTDAGGCKYIQSIAVAQPTALIPNTSVVHTCSAPSNGQAMVSVSGGTPPYAYMWSNGATASSTSGLSGGTYSVTVSDANGCKQTANVNIGIAPIVTASPSSSICIGKSTALTVGGATTYTWSPSTGLSSSTGANVNANPTVTTTYTVIGTDGNGCTNTATVTVTVNPAPAISSIGPCLTVQPVWLCTGTTASITANVSGGTSPYLYSWSTGGSTSSLSSLTLGTYTVTITDSKGCTITASKLVNNVTISSVTVSSATVCRGTSTTLTTTITPPVPNPSLVWNGPGVVNVAGSSLTVSPTTTSTYTVSVVNQGGGGCNLQRCTTYVSSTITVNQLPAIAITGSATTICNAQPVTLTASGGITYTWSPPTGLSTTTGATVTANPTATTTYTVTGTDANGCINKSTVTINLATYAANASANDVCSGTQVQLTASGGTTYQWSPPDGLSNTNTANPTATPTTTTTYSVTVTSGGCSSTIPVTVNVNPSPPVPVITRSNDTLFFNNDPSYTGYQWYFNNTILPGATDTFLVVTQNGNYTATVTNQNGCTAVSAANSVGGLPVELLDFRAEPLENFVALYWTTASEINNDYFTVEKSATVDNFSEITRVKGAGNSTVIRNYSAIDPDPYMGVSYYRLKQTDYDRQYEYSKIVAVNYNRSSTMLIKIYPNPAQDEIIVTGQGLSGRVNIQIHDVLGQIIYSADENPSIPFKKTIDLSRFAKGIYFLQVEDANNTWQDKLIRK